jgi:cell division initiation protein
MRGAVFVRWAPDAPNLADMPITPLEIQQQRFKSRFGGAVDKTEVEAFLTAVAAEVERLLRENTEIKDEARTQRRLLEDYRAREEALKETMITAQRVTDEIKKTAEKEADIIIGRAELEAERVQDAAVKRRSDLLAEIAELKRMRVQLIAQLRGVLGTHMKLVEVAEDEDVAERDNLAVMRKRPAPVATSDDDAGKTAQGR